MPTAPASGSVCSSPAAAITVRTASIPRPGIFSIRGLTLLGGEPFEPENQPEVLSLVQAVRTQLPEKTIWAYSGFTLEQLQSGAIGPQPVTRELLSSLDVLVDGKFVAELKDISLQFRGSSNQRILDIPQTLKTGRVCLWRDPAQL